MEAAGARRAVDAAISTVSSLDLTVDDAVVLSDSNRLVVRLTPCDIVARVTPMTDFASAEREVELVKRLTQTDSPVAALEARVEPRVFVRDGFKITMWTYSSLRSLEYFRRPITRRRSSVFMLACGNSMSRHRTSWIASRLLNETLRAVTSLPNSRMRTGRCSPTRCAI